jgi:hypothetical protein
LEGQALWFFKGIELDRPGAAAVRERGAAYRRRQGPGRRQVATMTACKTYRAGKLARTVWAGVALLCAAGVLVHSVGLFRGPPNEDISWLTHVGASLFVAVGSAAVVVIALTRLTTRLDVDALGMRCGMAWFSPGLDVRWDQVHSWSVHVNIESYTANDEWGNTYPVQTRHEHLEIIARDPLGQITLGKGCGFYKEILAELRAHVPTKEIPRSSSMPLKKHPCAKPS